MTVSRQTTLLFSFRSKIEEAVSLVPRMRPEEKLNAVQFWNIVSEKLQDIVNKCAADINAAALKMGEDESDKIEIQNPQHENISLTNPLSQDFLALSSNYAASNERVPQMADVDCGQLKQLFPAGEIFPGDEVSPDSGITSLNHIQSLSSIMSISKNSNSSCDHLLDIDNLTSSNCDTSILEQSNLLSLSPKDSVVESPTSSSKRKSSSNSKPRSAPRRSSRRKDAIRIKKENIKAEKSESDDSFSNDKSIFNAVLSDSNGENSLQAEDSVATDNEVKKSGSKYHQRYKKNSFGDKLLACKICRKQFDDVESLADHSLLHDKSYSCTDCNASFLTKGNLVVHMRKHTGEKPFACDSCSASFSTQGNLKRHKKIHSGERPWKCDDCDGCFREKKSLIVHRRRHTGEKPYRCKVCGKGFAQTGILQTHMAMHMDLKVHLCELCGKSFRQKSQLRVHKLRHDNIRKHGCTSCSSFFLTRGDLDRHARTHTGVKPFACDICSKTFTRQQSLNEHLNRHYNLTPYACKFCGKQFAEMSACYKHIKSHTKNSSEYSKAEGKSDLMELNESSKPPLEPVPEPGNSENELPALEGAYYTVVLDAKDSFEIQNDHQGMLYNEEPNAANGFGVLTAINLLTNVSSVPQSFQEIS